MKFRIPFLTLSLVLLSLIVDACPYLGDTLVYDRQAILRGELWRIGTAPLVHFSTSHLGWNLLVLGAAGWAVEASRLRSFWLVCGLSAVVPGLLYLLASPDLAVYGGLSGLATGAVAYLCLSGVFKAGPGRFLWLVVLVVMIGKIWTEAALEAPVFARSEDMPFRVLPLVHVVGIAMAAGAVFWNARGSRLRRTGRDSVLHHEDFSHP